MLNLQPKAWATDSFYFKMYLFYNLWWVNSTSLFTATWNQLFTGPWGKCFRCTSCRLHHSVFICTSGRWNDCDTKTNQFVETWGRKKIQPPLQTPKQMYPVLPHKALLLSTSLCQYKVFRAHNNKKAFVFYSFLSIMKRRPLQIFQEKVIKIEIPQKIYLYECKWGWLIIILT